MPNFPHFHGKFVKTNKCKHVASSFHVSSWELPPMNCNNISATLCLQWPWQFWRVLAKYLVEFPLTGLGLMVFSWVLEKKTIEMKHPSHHLIGRARDDITRDVSCHHLVKVYLPDFTTVNLLSSLSLLYSLGFHHSLICSFYSHSLE